MWAALVARTHRSPLATAAPDRPTAKHLLLLYNFFEQRWEVYRFLMMPHDVLFSIRAGSVYESYTQPPEHSRFSRISPESNGPLPPALLPTQESIACRHRRGRSNGRSSLAHSRPRGGRHARERATVMRSGWTAPAGSAASSWRATSRRAQPAAAARERRHGWRRRARRARRRRRRRRRHAMVHGRPARSGTARSSYRSLAAAAAGRRRVMRDARGVMAERHRPNASAPCATAARSASVTLPSDGGTLVLRSTPNALRAALAPLRTGRRPTGARSRA